MVSTVLFTSVRNAGRTQMAAAWFNALAHPDKARAVCAGTDPAGALYHQVVRAMGEVGLNIGASEPRLLTPLLLTSNDLVIVIGPPSPGALQIPGEHTEWVVDDPLGASEDQIRTIGREIERLVRQLLTMRHWMPLGASTPPLGAA